MALQPVLRTRLRRDRSNLQENVQEQQRPGEATKPHLSPFLLLKQNQPAGFVCSSDVMRLHYSIKSWAPSY